MKRLATVVLALACAAIPAAVCAMPWSGPGSFSGGQGTSVPVSALAMPSRWIDTSRMHISTELSFGTGWSGASSGLQVTRLSYQFKSPLQMSVSLGNAFGGGGNLNSGFFLEGLNLHYQPLRSLSINVSYQDVRSPLQYGNMRGAWLDPWYSPVGRRSFGE
ncbi:MAG: hypothetical protein HOP12_03125 [Candidatus Eisenbacteria bacterium]|uniref:Uncharacterized protein n=1 Tax=Eiseniibacteriota bacterium TaxID=2212470 RepID=A0A849SF84_UNCEI|nr:hypothetical protein [Candidatus Eisenbacteria bacterium]